MLFYGGPNRRAAQRQVAQVSSQEKPRPDPSRRPTTAGLPRPASLDGDLPSRDVSRRPHTTAPAGTPPRARGLPGPADCCGPASPLSRDPPDDWSCRGSRDLARTAWGRPRPASAQARGTEGPARVGSQLTETRSGSSVRRRSGPEDPRPNRRADFVPRRRRALFLRSYGIAQHPDTADTPRRAQDQHNAAPGYDALDAAPARKPRRAPPRIRGLAARAPPPLQTHLRPRSVRAPRLDRAVRLDRALHFTLERHSPIRARSGHRCTRAPGGPAAPQPGDASDQGPPDSPATSLTAPGHDDLARSDVPSHRADFAQSSPAPVASQE